MPSARSLQVKLRESGQASRLVEALYVPPSGSRILDPNIGQDPDDWRFTKHNASPRDLHPLIQQRMQTEAYRLYVLNPFAGAIVELTVAYTLSGDVTFQAKDPRVLEVIRNHWYDPINNWDEFLPQVALELSIFGEQLLPVAVDEDGNVQIGAIDPILIADVIPYKENSRIADQVYYYPTPGHQPVSKDLIRLGRTSQTGAFRTGEAFYFAINSVTAARRGISDLFRINDWLDGLDQFLFNRLERSTHLNSYIWDVKIEGASDAKIRQFADEIAKQPTKAGSFRVHNEKVSWTTVQPDMGGQETATEASLFKSHVLGGATFPGFFFADLNLGRMAAQEAVDPTYRRLTRRQRYYRHIIRSVLDFAIDQKILHQGLDANVDRNYSIFLPRVNLRDLQRSGGAMYRVAQSLEIAVKQGWVTATAATQTFRAMLDQLGVEILETETPGEAEAELPLPKRLARRM